MALTPQQELTAVRRALTKAIAAATEVYLVDQVGEDLPDSQLILEEYTYEIHPDLTKTSFMVRAMHRDKSAMSFHFEVKVSGG